MVQKYSPQRHRDTEAEQNKHRLAHSFILLSSLCLCASVVQSVFLFSVCAATTLHAQEEARAAWQVTRFDISVNLPASATADRALTARAMLAARNVGQGTGRTFTVRISPTAEIKAASVGDATARFIARTDSRTKLQQVTITLPGPIASGANVNVAIDYHLPVPENSGLAALSPEGSQFLPLSYWYPAPNTVFAPRGADVAPVRLTVNGASGETVVSTGQASGAAFEQKLNAQPFFLTGKWDVVDGSGEARGISAWLYGGASADERSRAEALITLASAARSFYTGIIGPMPDAPVRLVAVRRGAGFDMAGTVLLDASVFRRTKTDTVTALLIAEAVARLWIGGATAVRDEGAGVIREGLVRFLATLFMEKQFGREAAETERIRERIAYAAVARRDAPLSQSTPLLDTYYTSVANKGAMVWRLVDRALGRDAFMNVLRTQLQGARDNGLTLASLRAALAERGGEGVKNLLEGGLDQPTDIDLLVGVPQQRAGEWVAALRNVGSLNAAVTVAATTESGERLTVDAIIPPKDFGEARFKTTARIVRVEVDADKLYAQIDYSNDIAPRAPPVEESLAEVTRLLAQQEYARAEATSRELLRHMPLMQEARIMLGRALLEQNKTDEAEKEFRAVLGVPLPMPGTLAWANIGLGEIALRKGQPAEAAKRFNEAVRADAEYASTLAARAARIKAETTAGNAPPPDESARTFITQLDQAIRSGRKADLDALILPGELTTFSKGIVGNQPEMWQTRVLRTEPVGGDRLAADVSITAKTLGRDQSGTAVLVLSRVGGNWRLADIQLFEVR